MYGLPYRLVYQPEFHQARLSRDSWQLHRSSWPSVGYKLHNHMDRIMQYIQCMLCTFTGGGQPEAGLPGDDICPLAEGHWQDGTCTWREGSERRRHGSV